MARSYYPYNLNLSKAMIPRLMANAWDDIPILTHAV